MRLPFLSKVPLPQRKQEKNDPDNGCRQYQHEDGIVR